MSTKGFEVIDAHIHPFIKSENNLSTSWYKGISETENFFSKLKEAGVDKCCGSVIRPIKNPTWAELHALNTEAVKLQKKYNDFFLPGIIVHESYPDESCRELETMTKESGIGWVGELVPYMMGSRTYLSKEMLQIFDMAAQLNLPVNTHPTTLEELDELCSKLPDLKLVIAHPGNSKVDYQARLDILKKHPNAHLDISATGVSRYGMLRHGINESGRDRLLFGSDFPINNVHMQIQGILFEDLTDNETEAVLSGNFKRLYLGEC
ncbi:MAG: amidohydrolase family protein [Lentisphaerae bacterium]|nr:amidohydrolase family protein [Lentisphaerota bacterium]MCP4101133.1 amidohydrolase family protein [Lentisphaerota bacterium]